MTNQWLLATLPSMVSIACSTENSTISPTSPQPAPTTTTTVQVTNGYGSGTATIGDSVFIWSNPPVAGTVFDKWTGDISGLKYPNEWKSKVKISANGLALTATYKTVSAFQFVTETTNGASVYYYAPANYKGVILPFHGAGGSASGWIGTSIENESFVRYAVANGYAVVIAESVDRTNKRWSNTATKTPTSRTSTRFWRT